MLKGLWIYSGPEDASGSQGTLRVSLQIDVGICDDSDIKRGEAMGLQFWKWCSSRLYISMARLGCSAVITIDVIGGPRVTGHGC